MIKVVTIAGSDASGGAGLEADLKTFEEYGLYGMAAVTLIAVMEPDNWSHKVFPIAENVLHSQLETIFKGIGAAAVKTGMLGSFYAVDLAREYLIRHNISKYVLDPVMVCKGAGEPATLVALNPELNAAVEKKLLPLAEIVTPNLFEAQQLSGINEITGIDKMKEAAKIIHGKGVRNIFVKGGAKLAHAAKATDLFYDGRNFTIVEDELVETAWNHGAGCTTSAAIASGLARGLPVIDAVFLAKKFITASIKAGFALNKWVGPGNPSAWRTDRLFGI